MALTPGGGDSLSRQTQGRRALRPDPADVVSGVDIGDGTVGTFDPTYPDPSHVYYGIQYGPTGTEYTGTREAPPDNPVTESAADSEFDLADMLAAFGQTVQYVSEQIGGGANYITAVWLPEDVEHEYSQYGDDLVQRAHAWISYDDIPEPRTDRDTMTVDGVTYSVRAIPEKRGGGFKVAVELKEVVQTTGMSHIG